MAGSRPSPDLSFELARGEILGVIGPNGAGKTTLLNLITGYSVPNEGSILLEGKELRGLAPYEICRLGRCPDVSGGQTVRRDDASTTTS